MELGLVWSDLQERAEAVIDPKVAKQAESEEVETTGESTDKTDDEWKQIWITHGKHYKQKQI